MIHLFRALVADDVVAHVADAIQPDAEGRVWVGEGPTVKRFERALGEVYGGGRWLAVNSCTSALYLALHSLGVGPGDAVVSTPLTCSLTNSVVRMRFARILWADVDPRTGNLDPRSVASVVSRYAASGVMPKAIVAVDFAGRRVDYAGIRREVEEATALPCPPIVQDGAHLAPEFVGEPGARGDWVALSFQGVKFANTTDGGALLAPPGDYARAKKLRWAGLDRDAPGWRASQDIEEPGGKWHMTDVAAAFGLANLPVARGAARLHRENAAFYDARLRDLPGVRTPPWDPACSWWLYVLLAEDAAGLVAHLATRGVESSPVHRRNDAHSGFGGQRDLPGVDEFAPRQVAIPVGWWLSADDRAHVAESVREWALR